MRNNGLPPESHRQCELVRDLPGVIDEGAEHGVAGAGDRIPEVGASRLRFTEQETRERVASVVVARQTRCQLREVERAATVPVIPIVVAVLLNFAADLDGVVSANERHGVHSREGMEKVVARDVVTKAGIAFGVEIHGREKVELQSGKSEFAAIRLRPALIEPKREIRVSEPRIAQSDVVERCRREGRIKVQMENVRPDLLQVIVQQGRDALPADRNQATAAGALNGRAVRVVVHSADAVIRA